MPKRRRRLPRWPIQRPHNARPPGERIFVLDRFSAQDVERWNEVRDSLLKFYWDYHSDIARQRAKIVEDLKSTLARNARRGFEFVRWQRITTIKYALKPLSAKGSLRNVGGRFNIGDIEPTAFPPFPALYLAENKETALQETLAQGASPTGRLTAHDFALSNTSSIAIYSMSGKLDSVLDIGDGDALKDFVSLIKDFHISENLIKAAKALQQSPMELIRTVEKLQETLREPNWRTWPEHYDIPATTQIFGHLVKEAGIEGILYPSKFNKKLCLAVFPENFEGSESFVRLDDPPPEASVIKELTSDTWKNLT